MKIEITGTPRFWLAVDSATITTLMALSKNHYDGYCRTVGMPGGFLYGWNNQRTIIDPYNDNEAPTLVSGSFRDLDTTLKLCEGANYLSAEQQALAHSYAQSIRNALRVSNDISLHWRHELP